MALTEKRKKYLANWRAANRGKTREANRKWRESRPSYFRDYDAANRDVRNAYYAKWREANREQQREYHRGYFHRAEGRKAKALAHVRLRQTRKLHATPLWADLDAISAVYEEASRLGMTVDHIVPLKGKNVCGLHIENNLQLLSRSDNARKSNKLPPEHEYTAISVFT